MQVLVRILKFNKELLTLKGQVEKNTLEINSVREDINQLTPIAQDLKHAIEIH